MKKTFTTDAINLKNYPLNDNDSIVVMFSREKGLMRAVAKGSKRPKSKLGARIQMFIANKLMMFEGRNLDTISEAQSLNTFSRIRSDLDKITYSMYIAELVNTFCSKNYNNDESYQEIYDLLYKVYDKIASCNSRQEAILYSIKFLIHFLSILGWGLDFSCCSTCQKPLNAKQDESSVFSFELGGFICNDCAVNHPYNTIKIHNKIKAFLCELSISKLEEKTKYDDLVNDVVLEKCFSFMKKYTDNLTNKRTKVFEVLSRSAI
ncbi:MAG: DNA repair protein RecO [Candidatus Gastranaerophilales bacterium]|nr:DNA repair protein RecO [Candidatus Gastranaerophilales bacterium]